MLTTEGCLSRRTRLWDRIDRDVDLVLIAAPWHIHYLANYYVSPSTLNIASTSFLALERNGAARLFVDNWTAPIAQGAHVDEVKIYTWYDMRDAGHDRHAGVVDLLVAWLRPQKPRRVAIEAAHLPWGVAGALAEMGTTLANITPDLLALRYQKDPDELACARKAVRAGEAAHATARIAVQPGASEIDVYNAIRAAVVKVAGAAVMALGDFASGERAEGGGDPVHRILAPGDLMIVDFFPVIDGYRADFTNTYVAGQPSDAQRRHMDLLLQAKAAGEAMLRPGVTGGQVYAAVRGAFERAGVAHLFPHHAGHALGLMHPEAPFLVPTSQEPLRENQVIAMEPGLYDPTVGGMRIEDNYLITATGYERLSNHLKGF